MRRLSIILFHLRVPLISGSDEIYACSRLLQALGGLDGVINGVIVPLAANCAVSSVAPLSRARREKAGPSWLGSVSSEPSLNRLCSFSKRLLHPRDSRGRVWEVLPNLNRATVTPASASAPCLRFTPPFDAIWVDGPGLVRTNTSGPSKSTPVASQRGDRLAGCHAYQQVVKQGWETQSICS